MPSKSIGDQIQFFRARAGLTQVELAQLAGISVRAIRDLERGRARKPQKRTVDLLAAALGLAAQETELLWGLAASQAQQEAGSDDTEFQPGIGEYILPPLAADFTGRGPEFAWLKASAELARRKSTMHVALVHGIPGMGKTALAVQAGHQLGSSFPDGCFFVNLRGLDVEPLSVSRVARMLLVALGIAADNVPADDDERLAFYRWLMRERRVLLIADNASSEAQIRPLLVSSPGSMMIVTSRYMLAGLDTVGRLELGVLDADSAVSLLGAVVGPEVLATDPVATAEIAHLCSGVPLALRIAGHQLAGRFPGRPVSEFAAQFADERRRLSLLASGDVEVRVTFELSHRLLTPVAAAMFRRLSVLSGTDVGLELAAVVAGQSPASADAALTELADASLLRTSAVPGRYSFHDLIRLFARERQEVEEGTADLASRTNQWLLNRAVAAAEYFNPEAASLGSDCTFADRISAGAWLRQETDHWLGALRWAVRERRHDEVLELAHAMHWYSDHRGTGELWSEVFSAGVDAAQALGRTRDLAVQLNFLCWTLVVLQAKPVAGLAVHHRALRAALMAGDLVEQAWAWCYRGNCERKMGNLATAISCVEQAVSMFATANHPVGQNLALSFLGHLYSTAGQIDRAIALNREAIARHRASTPAGNGTSDDNLATVLVRLARGLTEAGEYDEANAVLEEAEQLFAGAPFGLARLHIARGQLRHVQGRLVEASAELTMALDGIKELDMQIVVMIELAQISTERAEPETARQHLIRALELCSRGDSPEIRANRKKIEEALAKGR